MIIRKTHLILPASLALLAATLSIWNYNPCAVRSLLIKLPTRVLYQSFPPKSSGAASSSSSHSKGSPSPAQHRAGTSSNKPSSHPHHKVSRSNAPKTAMTGHKPASHPPATQSGDGELQRPWTIVARYRGTGRDASNLWLTPIEAREAERAALISSASMIRRPDCVLAVFLAICHVSLLPVLPAFACQARPCTSSQW